MRVAEFSMEQVEAARGLVTALDVAIKRVLHRWFGEHHGCGLKAAVAEALDTSVGTVSRQTQPAEVLRQGERRPQGPFNPSPTRITIQAPGVTRAERRAFSQCGVAQLAARRVHTPEVAGSSPAPATTFEAAIRPSHDGGVLPAASVSSLDRQGHQAGGAALPAGRFDSVGGV